MRGFPGELVMIPTTTFFVFVLRCFSFSSCEVSGVFKISGTTGPFQTNRVMHLIAVQPFEVAASVVFFFCYVSRLSELSREDLPSGISKTFTVEPSRYRAIAMETEHKSNVGSI